MIKQANPRRGTREELEVKLRRLHPGAPIYYLGMLGPDQGSQSVDPWQVHAWEIGRDPSARFRGRDRQDGGGLAVRAEDIRDLPMPTIPERRPAPIDPAMYRREWAEPEERQEFPAPAVTSRDPHPEQIPGPVFKLYGYAQAHGWKAEVTYSRGCLPHATHGRPGEPKDLWAVRMAKRDMRAVAVQHSGGWKSLWTWSPRRIMVRNRLFAEFEEQLMGEF